jgi:hypothetical protein
MAVNYHGILTLEKVELNYSGIFVTLNPGQY